MATNNEAPFTIRADYTAIAVMYRNRRYIADDVFPRVTVNSSAFVYDVYPVGTMFSIPDTKVGRKSRPGQIEETITETSGVVQDYAIDVPVPNRDVMQMGNRNPAARAVVLATNTVALDREKRCADILYTAGNYGTNNKATIAGDDQWNDATGISKPYTQIMDAIASMPVEALKIVMGGGAFNVLVRHAQILAGVFGTNNPGLAATAAQLATLFGVNEVIVGRAKVNTAKKGQTPTLVDIWGDFVAIIGGLPAAGSPDIAGAQSFAITAQWGTKVAGTIPDPHMGMRGGNLVRSGESVKELLTATDMGYLLSDVLI